MILQALNRYYEILAAEPESNIAPYGYSTAGFSYAIELSKEGELAGIFPLFVPSRDGKKEVPLSLNVPEKVKRSGTNPTPNFLWDNATFVLGISEPKGKDPAYCSKRFNAFKEFNLSLLAQADCDAARAVIGFYEHYDPASAPELPAVKPVLEGLKKGGNLVFRYAGKYAHEDPAIRRVWEERRANREAVMGQCLVSGERAPIARLHPSLQGIRNASSTGASLVSFNERAYESYNRSKAQGLNAPVSEKATYGYTTALNYLLSSVNPNPKIYLGDTTVVYWAESANKKYASVFSMLFNPEYAATDETGMKESEQKKAEERLGAVANGVKRGGAVNLAHLMDGLDETTRFYVLGLASNRARAVVRFFLCDAFGVFVARIMQHYKDLEIDKEFSSQNTYLTAGQLLWETIPKAATVKEAAPLLAGALSQAVLNGGPYPAALYYAILNRIRAEGDTKKSRKINITRAAFIKAFLLRKFRNYEKNPYEEVLTMSLNEKSAQPAYLLGRLFAVLEKVQHEAIGETNASIKDRYFTAACANPRSVFPVLLRLAQHHIAKAEYGKSSDRRVEEILGKLDIENNPIPTRLTLDEQGIFILGYYHQRQAFFVKNGTNQPKKSGEEN
jgi:CRISPR-associated protein Csd1